MSSRRPVLSTAGVDRRAAVAVLWDCKDPRCCLCSKCLAALRKAIEPRRPKPRPAVGPDDPIRVFRSRGVNARKA